MSFLDPVEDWCPAWAYGTCACPQMCPDDRMTTNRAPLSRCADCRRADGGAAEMTEES